MHGVFLSFSEYLKLTKMILGGKNFHYELFWAERLALSVPEMNFFKFYEKSMHGTF